jgi:hypothetical protein
MRRLLEGRALQAIMTPSWIKELDAEYLRLSEAGRMDPGQLRETCYIEAVKREANPENAFGALLRVGTQRVADKSYDEETKSFSVRTVAMANKSDKKAEFYNPLESSETPELVPEGQAFNEGQVKGINVIVPNYKFGKIEAFTNELWEDEQTGQLKGRQGKMGIAMARLEEIYFAIRYLGAAGSYGNLTVPADPWTTQEGSTTWAGVNPGGIFTFSANDANTLNNRLETFGPLSVPRLKEAFYRARRIKDLQNVRLGWVPNYLLVSATDEFNAAGIMRSAYYAGVVGRSTQTQNVATSGEYGGQMSENVFKGSLEIALNRYLSDWVWSVGKKGEGFVFQERTGLEIVQEVPNSGRSFEYDEIRMRTKKRFEQAWLDPRFAVLGNDGSVVGGF